MWSSSGKAPTCLKSFNTIYWQAYLNFFMTLPRFLCCLPKIWTVPARRIHRTHLGYWCRPWVMVHGLSLRKVLPGASVRPSTRTFVTIRHLWTKISRRLAKFKNVFPLCVYREDTQRCGHCTWQHPCQQPHGKLKTMSYSAFAVSNASLASTRPRFWLMPLRSSVSFALAGNRLSAYVRNTCR